jgi:hypothetical protein
MANTEPRARRYPFSCLSANCGYITSDKECQACPNRPALDDFYAWKERTGAICTDPIWGRNFYEVPEA